jgi:soluble lytic murein transglycosylase
MQIRLSKAGFLNELAENLATSVALGLLFICFALPTLQPTVHLMESPETVGPLAAIRMSLLTDTESAPSATSFWQEPAPTSYASILREGEQVDFVSDLIRVHRSAGVDAQKLAAAIVSECARANYDPVFVSAVIHAESMFKNSAVSERGAQGLMQIMPETGRYISQRENIAWSGSHTLRDPRMNVRLGVSYLKYLEKKFNGNRERALIAYNWGPANVDQALKGRARPPTQSVNYARKILSNHRRWSNKLVQMANNIGQTEQRFIG